jgi:hypothetical protein
MLFSDRDLRIILACLLDLFFLKNEQNHFSFILSCLLDFSMGHGRLYYKLNFLDNYIIVFPGNVLHRYLERQHTFIFV